MLRRIAWPLEADHGLWLARQLAELAETAPKSMKWKLRSNVGDRVRWYELPEEVDH